MFCISAVSVVTSPFSFLILLIWVLSLFFLMSLAKGRGRRRKRSQKSKQRTNVEKSRWARTVWFQGNQGSGGNEGVFSSVYYWNRAGPCGALPDTYVTEPNLGPLAHVVKPIYWHWVEVKESAAFITRHWYKKNMWLVLKNPQLPEGFQQSIFKGQVREGGCRVCDRLVLNSLTGW